MSDETELETILQNLRTGLDCLNKCGNVDSLLCRLESQGNRKVLKKVKNLTLDVHKKINSIKESVSKRYKKVKEHDSDSNSDKDGHSDNSLNTDVIHSKHKKKSSQSSNKNNKEVVETVNCDNNNSVGLDSPSSDNETLASLVNDNTKSINKNKDDDVTAVNAQLKVPKIKLVDINKLLALNATSLEMTPPAPTKTKKSVSFDSSVIIQSSSDEESLKKNTRKSRKIEEEYNQNKKNRRRVSKVSEEDDSDSDFQPITRSSIRQSKLKETFSKLVKKRSSKRQKKELLEESSLSEGSSDESEKATNTRKRSVKEKKDVPKPIELDTSLEDSKLKSQVFIRIPKFACEELQSLYEHKKEVSDIKNLAKLPPMDSKSDSTEVKKKITLTLKLNKPKEVEAKCDSESDIDSESSTKNQDGVESSNVQEMASKSDSASESPKTQDDMNDTNDRDEVESVGDMPVLSPPIGDGDLLELADSCLDQVVDSDKEPEVSSMTQKETEPEEVEKPEETKDKPPEQTAEQETVSTEVEAETEVKTPENEPEKTKSPEPVLLDSNSESDEEDQTFAQFSAKNELEKKELVKEAKKKANKRKNIITDSEDDGDDEPSGKSDEEVKSDKDGGEVSDSQSKKEEETNSPARKRIKRVRDSSSEDDDKSTRKHLRRMIDKDSLSETTKKAEQDEKERKERIADKQKKYNEIFELKSDAIVDKVVLDFDEQSNEPLLSIHKKLARQLKPHQVQGVKFMWDASFESLKRAKEGKGSGCILAHCMGLGKTLQVIALVHTLITNAEKTNVHKVMVVCPVNTVLNWKSEFKKWIPKSSDLDVYELVSSKTNMVNHERNYVVKCWHEDGGVLIIGYNMFRNLSNPDNKAIPKKLRASFHAGLVDPGPDLVVCDEGHLLKNEKTNLSIAMNRIKTLRRIVLTGTPLQNNLREYWCMVQFIKPNLLGTYKEYLNRFVNPITNGQYTDSTPRDIEVMRRRSHVLHKLLDGVVQRQDYAVLEPYLPPKHEYVIFVKPSELQCKLYRHYMEHLARRSESGSNRTSFLFTDFQELQRICTHPRVLLEKSLKENNNIKEKEEDTDSEGSLKDFIDDSEEEESSAATSKSENSSSDNDSDGSKPEKKQKQTQKSKHPTRRTRLTRAQAAQRRENGDDTSDVEEVIPVEKYWWEEYVTREELDNVNLGSKVFLLFQILKECEDIGDKVLVFSQSLYTLNCIEYFLARIDEATQKGENDKVGGHSGSWSLGLDYFRLDGSSSCDNRANWCDEFNDPNNIRARLFLISTKAGGLGINLVAANRVIIFDVSWNPSHDIQSIYRVYRFGQTKPSYIYRFVTYGTMEMKIYERQVTKQAISKRVIDEQQIDRHYSQNDIQELYKTDLDPTDRPVPLVPKDVLLGEMVQKHESIIFKYHEHQSLLENKQDEELNEEERKAAWEEFENEKVLRKTTVNFTGVGNLSALYNNTMNISPNSIHAALANIVRRDNPGWSEVQIKGVIPALIAQLQIQMSENDFNMYYRVQNEIRMMQLLQQQRLFNQTMLLKQQQANQRLGNMNITAEELRRLQMRQAPSVAAPVVQEIIDLDD